MIMQTLRQSTQTQHEQLEQRVDLMQRVSTPGGYLHLLEQFYGFYVPLEARLAAVPDLNATLDFNERRKIDLLKGDLAVLGLSEQQLANLPLCQDLPTLADTAQALGCLYVIEGSTLGGQIIARHLRESTPYTATHGAAFFYGYGEQTGARWKAFGAAVTAFADSPEREAAILAAAHGTFNKLDQWLAVTA